MATENPLVNPYAHIEGYGPTDAGDPQRKAFDEGVAAERARIIALLRGWDPEARMQGQWTSPNTLRAAANQIESGSA